MKTRIKVLTDREIAKKTAEIKGVTVVTHNGVFHADEVFACALLSLSLCSKDITILRTRDQKIIENCNFAVDVGGKYDGVSRFDHHQGIFQNASAGMVYQACQEGTLSLPEGLLNERNASLIAEVDAHDLGKKRAEVAQWVASFNLEGGSSAFKKVLELVIELLKTGDINPLKKEAQKNIDLGNQIRKEVEKNIKTSIGNTPKEVLKKGILIIDSLEVAVEGQSYKGTLQDVFHYINGTETGNLVHSIIVDQFSAEGDFQQTNVQKVPPYEGSFEFLGEPYKAQGGEIFVHPAGFFMATPSKEVAVESLSKQLPSLPEKEGKNKELCALIRDRIS